MINITKVLINEAMSNNPCELEALNTQFQARFWPLALCEKFKICHFCIFNAAKAHILTQTTSFSQPNQLILVQK